GEKSAMLDGSRIVQTFSLENNGEVAKGKGRSDTNFGSTEQIHRFMQEFLADELKVPLDSIPTDESLIHAGVDSMAALALCNALQARLGIELTIAEVLGGSSIGDLAQKILLTRNGA